jgi:hypothetical protein
MAYEDLLKDTSKPDPDNKDYFLLTVTDLNPGEVYPIELRWVYKDDKTEKDKEWSVVKNLIPPAETINAPQFNSGDLAADGFNIVVKWSGLDSAGNAYTANLDRVEIFIKGGQYGATSTYSGRSFKSTGTETFAVNTSDTYYVKLRAVSKRNGYSAFSTERATTTVAPLTVDTQGPDNVSSSGMTISAGVDSSGAIGFNGYIDLGWSAVTGGGIRGYRIRFRTGTSNYSYVDSPGTGVTYRLRGLAVGATYEIGIATYDEFNNTSSSYTSFTSTAIGGTPFVGTNVNTTGYFSAGTSPNDFQFGYGIDPSNNSNTFAGTKRGVYLTSSNYWVIDSLQSAKFKVGGTTSNYIYWNGSSLSIDGNLGVAGGTSIGGNIALTTTGASIYNGTLDVNGALASGTSGFILNKDGLQFKYLGNDSIKLQASDGTLFANNATITGTIRTAASTSYPRVELRSTSSKDYIFFYDAAGQVGAINVTGSGNGGMYFTAPSATASQIALYSSNHASYPGRTSLLDGAGSTLFYIESNYMSFSYGSTSIFTVSNQGMVISENNTIDNSGNRAVRNIQSTTTTGYPTASGRIGDIIVVREA